MTSLNRTRLVGDTGRRDAFARGGGSHDGRRRLARMDRRVRRLLRSLGRPRDLAKNKQLTESYGRANAGNVSLIGEVDLVASGGRFMLSLGVGPDPEAAGHHAACALLDDPASVRDAYVAAGSTGKGALDPPPAPTGSRDLSRVSTSVLKSHEALLPPARLPPASLPPGRGPGSGSIPRPGGLSPRLASRPSHDGRRFARRRGESGSFAGPQLPPRHQMPDGHWPQNMWVSGAEPTGTAFNSGKPPCRSSWSTSSAGEGRYQKRGRRGLVDGPAAPRVISSGRGLRRRKTAGRISKDTPHSRSAASSRRCSSPPIWPTGLPSRALLLIYVTPPTPGTPQSRLAAFLPTRTLPALGIDGYYLRIVPPELDEVSTPKDGRLTLRADPPGNEGRATSKIVSVDALCLVRFGLRRPDDPRIINTLKVIDANLRVETPQGPSWHRYTADGYGEHADGSPFTHRDGGTFGRAWPLLTGERAHYELMAGRRAEAERLTRAMAAFAGAAGMISEQVWDVDDLPGKRLGRPAAHGFGEPARLGSCRISQAAPFSRRRGRFRPPASDRGAVSRAPNSL